MRSACRSVSEPATRSARSSARRLRELGTAGGWKLYAELGNSAYNSIVLGSAPTWFLYHRNMTREDILNVLAANRERLDELAVHELALFGSHARNDGFWSGGRPRPPRTRRRAATCSV